MHFISDDVSKGRLANILRTVEQNAAKWFATSFGCVYQDTQFLLNLVLPYKLSKPRRRWQTIYDALFYIRVDNHTAHA